MLFSLIAPVIRRTIFSQGLHCASFNHVQYHIKAFWQSNYKQSIVTGSRWYQSIKSQVPSLSSFFYILFCCATGTDWPITPRCSDCRAVTGFRFTNVGISYLLFQPPPLPVEHPSQEICYTLICQEAWFGPGGYSDWLILLHVYTCRRAASPIMSSINCHCNVECHWR